MLLVWSSAASGALLLTLILGPLTLTQYLSYSMTVENRKETSPSKSAGAFHLKSNNDARNAFTASGSFKVFLMTEPQVKIPALTYLCKAQPDPTTKLIKTSSLTMILKRYFTEVLNLGRLDQMRERCLCAMPSSPFKAEMGTKQRENCELLFSSQQISRQDNFFWLQPVPTNLSTNFEKDQVPVRRNR